MGLFRRVVVMVYVNGNGSEIVKVIKHSSGGGYLNDYFVGQLIPSTVLIDDSHFLLCDGSNYTYTTAQKAVLPTVLTSTGKAPNLVGKTVTEGSAAVGSTQASQIPYHKHISTTVVSGIYGTGNTVNRGTGTDTVSIVEPATRTGTSTAATGRTGTDSKSKSCTVYWYLFVGED